MRTATLALLGAAAAAVGLYVWSRTQSGASAFSGLADQIGAAGAGISEDLSSIGEALGMSTRGIRNNNPGNLEASGIQWDGMTGADSAGYLIFSSPQMGARALGHDLATAINEGYNTLAALLAHYAPASENNVPAYVADVAERTGIADEEPLSAGDATVIAGAIAVHENGAGPWTAPDGTVYTESDVASWAGMA